MEGCKDPALLYYRAQDALGDSAISASSFFSYKPAADKKFRLLIGRLQAVPGWAGLAHSVRGDAYYWRGIYSLERTPFRRPFTAQRYF
jgi:hypothetical protein